MPIKQILVSSALAWMAFGAYLYWAVPWIEGQSADRVPEIDLLGVLRVEQPGQWLSLFPAEAWQRNPQLRNIIQADGNILLYKQYEHLPDGNLKVAGLTLLLFNSTSDNNSIRSESENDQAFPVVVESLDDAILKFKRKNAPGLARYGDLKQIEFAGEVTFWRSGPTFADTFQLETRELTISGTLAQTKAPLQFRFGNSSGTATGLEIVFENSDQIHTAAATLTKISGIRHLRLQQLHKLNIAVDDPPVEGVPVENSASTMNGRHAALESQRIEISCTGPAQFSFSQFTARFSDDVRVWDSKSQHTIVGNELLVQFEKAASDPIGVSPTESENSPVPSLLPKGLQAREILALGAPAQVRSADQSLRIEAKCLSFNVPQHEFVAGNLPRQATDWMQAAVLGYNKDVEVNKDSLRLVVPHLRYKSPSELDRANPSEGSRSFGALEAIGGGNMWYWTNQAAPPVVLQWSDRLLAGPDPESDTQLLIRVLGSTRTQLDAESTILADALYLWMHQANSPTESPATASRDSNPLKSPREGSAAWLPDLLLAEKNVHYQSAKLRAALQEARVYFPPPEIPTTPIPQIAAEHFAVATESLPNRSGNLTETAQGGSRRISAQVESNRTMPATFNLPENNGSRPVANASRTRNTWINARSMIVQLANMPTTPLRLSNATRGTPEHRYNMESIELVGDVLIEEIELESGAPNQQATTRLHGQRIVGVAQDLGSEQSGTLAANQRRATGLQNQNLLWTLSAGHDSLARVTTPEAEVLSAELHFDQATNMVWTAKPGSLSFTIPATESDSSSPLAMANGKRLAAGRGSARWKSSLQFNGQAFVLDGEVALELEQNQEDGDVQRLQAYGDRLHVELSEPVRMSDSTNQPTERLSVRRLLLQKLEQTATGAPMSQPVRVYHQRFSVDQTLMSQEVVWAPEIELQPTTQRMVVSGPGSLWSVRAEDAKPPRPGTGNPASDELTYLKVQFQRTLEGRWGQGTYTLSGPVAALYGKAADWQIMDDENRLLTPIRLTSDSMTIQRLQTHATAPFTLEWEANGRVHVRGEQFEGTAHSITFAQAQDRLTLRGDSRAPAKFWQLNSEQRNHLSAQKILYRPRSQDFDFEGFQEGNLNFFSGRRGQLERQ